MFKLSKKTKTLHLTILKGARRRLVDLAKKETDKAPAAKTKTKYKITNLYTGP